MAEENLVTVMLVEDMRLDPRELSKDIASVLRITPVEARMMMRRSRGVIMAKGTPKQARLLCQTLAQRRIDTHIVPLKHLPVLPLPTKIAYMERSDEMLTYRGADTRISGAIAWRDILAVVAAPVGLEAYQAALDRVTFKGMPNLKQIDDPEAAQILRENMILKVSGSQEERESNTKRRENERKNQILLDEIEKKHAAKVKVYIDIIPQDLGIWIRASMAESAYQFQEGGVRMGSALGFTHLLNDLRTLATQARISPSLPALLEPSELADAILADVEEMGNYTTWMTYVAWLSGARGKGGDVETITFDDLPPAEGGAP